MQHESCLARLTALDAMQPAYLGFCVCGPHCQSAGTVAAAHVRLYSAGDSIGGVPTGAGAVAEPTASKCLVCVQCCERMTFDTHTA